MEKIIFIADDDVAIRRLFIRNISVASKITVLGFESESVLLEAEETPDVIFLDGNFERVLGWTLIPAIKQKWPNVKIVGHSAYAGAGPVNYEEEFLKAGADYYKKKGADTLSQLIEFILSL